MSAILAVVLLTSLAFLGTMFDNFFAFAAQLVVTAPERFRRVSWSQALAVATIVVLAATVGSLTNPIPIRWLGLLSIAPFGFAVQSWRRRATPRAQFRRGAVTTFAITLSLGGDNLAVWIPLLRSNHLAHALVSVATLALWELLFLVGARGLVRHPRVARWGNSVAPRVMPFVYASLGVLVLLECHTL